MAPSRTNASSNCYTMRVSTLNAARSLNTGRRCASLLRFADAGKSCSRLEARDDVVATLLSIARDRSCAPPNPDISPATGHAVAAPLDAKTGDAYRHIT